MLSPAPELPTPDDLAAMLTEVLSDNGIVEGSIRIAGRRKNAYASSYPSEIVQCDLGSGNTLDVFCKYGREDAEEPESHRSGLGYEAAVYDRVLRAEGVAAPRYYGTHGDGPLVMLAIEHLGTACRLNKSPDPDAICRAASCLAKFHALNDMSCPRDGYGFLKRHDRDYYLHWARRAQSRTRELNVGPAYPWVDLVCERFVEVVDELSDAHPVVIHGECYPKNVLVSGERVVLVDWQSAAVAGGEVDLASLTENWGEAVEDRCRSTYESQRRPRGRPEERDRRFTLARLYWHLRWLGGKQLRAGGREFDWRCTALRSAARRLGLI